MLQSLCTEVSLYCPRDGVSLLLPALRFIIQTQELHNRPVAQWHGNFPYALVNINFCPLFFLINNILKIIVLDLCYDFQEQLQSVFVGMSQDGQLVGLSTYF